MYFNNKSRENSILQVDNNFATLVNVTQSTPDSRAQYSGDELQFEFTYKLSQVKAIQEKTYSVAITIKTKNKSRPVILTSRKLGMLNTSNLIDNILTHRTKINNINLNEKESLVAYKQGDITSKINNHVLAYIKANLPLDNVGFQKTKIIVSKLEEKNQNESNASSIVTQDIRHSTFIDTNLNVKSDSKIDAKSERLNLIKKSLQPSVVTEVTNRSISTYDNLSGLIRKNTYPEYVGSPITNLVNSYLFQGQLKNKNQQYVTSVGQSFDDTITIKTKISIKNMDYDLLNVKFELLQSSNAFIGNVDQSSRSDVTSKNLLPLEIVEKDLNVSEHIKNYFMPTSAPSIFASKTASNITLQIKQNDDKSSGIKIYKRALSISNNDINTTYKLIDQINLSKSNGLGCYKYVNLNNESAIYRVVAYNKYSPNSMSSNFSDVVVNDNKTNFIKKMIIIPLLSEQGIEVIAYNTFSNVVSARLLIRDVTNKQKSYSIAEDVFNFSSKDFSSTLNITKNLIPYHTYELTTKIIEKNGIETQSSYTTLIEYVPFSGNPFDIRIAETRLSTDVQFSVNANLIQDQIGTLSSLLSQMSSNYSLEDLKSRNAKYDKFIAFNIVRYNITTGDVENMGIIANNSTFIDSQEAAKYSSKPLSQFDKYKYVIYPLVRDPATVISQKQEKIDLETRKRYNINQRKHLHPLTLTRGNIVSSNVISNDLDPKDDLLYGFIGTSYHVDASLISNKPLIESFNVSLINDKDVFLSWKISGNREFVDHIVILREIDGIRKIIGKTHCLVDGSLNVTYSLTQHDIGNIRFILVPVYNDFSSGQISISNELLVHSVE